MNGLQKTILGVFFTIAFAILFVYTVFLTDFRLFGAPEMETVYFEEAYGLDKGSAVLVLGHRVGRVESVEYEMDAPPERRIRVLLSMSEPVELFAGSRIVIREADMLGSKQINIYPGPAGIEPILRESDGSLLGEIELNPVARLGDLGIVFTENREAARSIRTDIVELWDDVQAGRGTVGRFVQDDSLSDGLFEALDMVQGVGGEIESGQGLFTMMMSDASIVDDFGGMADRFNSLGTDLEDGDGLIGRLVYNDDIVRTIKDTADRFSAVGEGVQSGSGLAGRIYADDGLSVRFDELVDSFDRVRADFDEIVTTFEDGEGSAAKLYNEENLGARALSGLGFINRSTEDFREAAPIVGITTAFFALGIPTNVIRGAF